MKVQCSCGTKYAFDPTPEMAQNPIQLVCQNCGADISSFVNQLILQELQSLAEEVPPVATPLPPGPVAAPAFTPVGEPVPAAPAPPAPRTRIAVTVRKTETAPAAPAAAEALPRCVSHALRQCTHRCLVCQKPICPECMRLFGYVCSPFCKQKAKAQHIELPAYESQEKKAEKREWRNFGLLVGGAAAAILVLVGVYVWYLYWGRMPSPYFSTRFDKRADSGVSALCGDNQIVFLHGPTLARYDTKSNKQIWSRELVTQKDIEADTNWLDFPKLTMDEKIERAAGRFHLNVNGRSVWIIKPGKNSKMTRYDWDSGQPGQEVPLTGGYEAIVQKDELQIMGYKSGQHTITHVSLANGEKRVEEVADPLVNGKPRPVALATVKAPTGKLSLQSKLPPGLEDKDTEEALDPAKVVQEVHSLSTPARIALPAVLAIAWEQQRLEKELKEGETPPKQKQPPPNLDLLESYALIPLQDGCLQFGTRLLEERSATRVAMKERPKKSALDDVKVTDTDAVANEILNDMQRDFGGDKVTEDVSRYWVTLRRADDKSKAEWVGEVIGPPGVMPLDTVNVLCAGKSIYVFDKANKKLWEATLTFTVPLHGFYDSTDAGEPSNGAGPCVEHNGVLYVADQGVLTAFDLANGVVKWRLPSVGVMGIFFDEQGMVYVNTTTANLDSLKYSRQIDVTKNTDAVILKIDSKTGKTLWTAKVGSGISYIAGKYIYVLTSYPGDYDENGEATTLIEAFAKPAFLHIKRLDPKTGKVIWLYRQLRCPLDVKFRDNTFQFVFRKEVQAVKFWTF